LNPQLLLFDLDGTLLNKLSHISSKEKKLLQQLQAQGMHIAINTGRPARDARFHASLISDQTYYIGSNGTYVGQVNQAEPITNLTFSLEQKKAFFELADSIHKKPIFYTPKGRICLGLKNYLMFQLNAFKGEHPYPKCNFVFFNRAKFEEYIYENDVNKVVLIEASSQRHTLKQYILNEGNFELAITGKICFEMTPKAINKSIGAAHLAEYLHIPKENVMAFGDGENDIAVMRWAGMGIAMGNASSHVKELADAVCDSNDRHGIYHFLLPYLK